MTQTKMPEPVAFRWRVPIVDSEGRQCGESNWKFGTEKGGLPWWTRDSLITTTQAEAYAKVLVRAALEKAASICEDAYKHGSAEYAVSRNPYFEGGCDVADVIEQKILALIPKEST